MTFSPSNFETYLLDEEHEETTEMVKELSSANMERSTYPEGFFSEL